MELRIFLFLCFLTTSHAQEITSNAPTLVTPTEVATKQERNGSSSILKPSYKEYNFVNCNESNLDECGKVIFLFGNQNLHLPINRKQIKPFCRMQKSGAKCILEWGKNCLTSFPRQALLMMVRGVNKNLKERCSNEGANLYMKNKACLRKSSKGQNKCMMQFRDDLNAVTTHPVKSEWLPSICCSIEKWKQCFNESVSGSCDQDGLEYLKSSAHSYTSELQDVACSTKNKYSSGHCNEIMIRVAESKSKFDSENNSTTATNPQSVILPMFKLVTSYTDTNSKVTVN